MRRHASRSRASASPRAEPIVRWRVERVAQRRLGEVDLPAASAATPSPCRPSAIAPARIAVSRPLREERRGPSDLARRRVAEQVAVPQDQVEGHGVLGGEVLARAIAAGVLRRAERIAERRAGEGHEVGPTRRQVRVARLSRALDGGLRGGEGVGGPSLVPEELRAEVEERRCVLAPRLRRRRGRPRSRRPRRGAGRRRRARSPRAGGARARCSGAGRNPAALLEAGGVREGAGRAGELAELELHASDRVEQLERLGRRLRCPALDDLERLRVERERLPQPGPRRGAVAGGHEVADARARPRRRAGGAARAPPTAARRPRGRPPRARRRRRRGAPRGAAGVRPS